MFVFCLPPLSDLQRSVILLVLLSFPKLKPVCLVENMHRKLEVLHPNLNVGPNVIGLPISFRICSIPLLSDKHHIRSFPSSLCLQRESRKFLET